MAAKVAKRAVEIGGLDTETEMIDVGAAFDARFGSRDEIDHAGAGAKLNKADAIDATLLAETEDTRVEVEHPLLIAAAQHDMIEFRNLQWNLQFISSARTRLVAR